MDADRLSRNTVRFVNIAHAFDHFVLLIYPTAVIAIAAERQLDYGTLIGLSTGAFVAFGLFSLPMGWIAERIGGRNLLAIFFFGYGLSCIGMATARGSTELACWLLVLGVFSAIYHPVGSAMLVTHTRRLGRDLGWNGVWGNLGAASASAVTAALAATFGWRVAFVAPGLACLAVGVAFLFLVPGDGHEAQLTRQAAPVARHDRPLALLLLFAIAIIAGGMTFNVTTIALPKVIDERVGLVLPLAVTGSLATAVFLFGAAMQLSIGRLIDRYSLPSIFVALSVLQPVGLGLAAFTTGIPLLLGMSVAMAAIYGQVVINDAMIARYVPVHYRAKAFSVRYFLGFTASGVAAPMIAILHAHGGFPSVLAAAAAFGGLVFACAILFRVFATPGVAVAAPAE
jgi:MFS family permease